MKKLLAILVCLLTFSLAGCMGLTAMRAVEQCKLAMANEEYSVALNHLESALQKGAEQEEVIELIAIIENYIIAEEAFSELDIEGTISALEKIPESYKNYVIADKIDYLTERVSNTNVVDTYYVVNCKQSITLRKSPSVKAPEITQIPLGQAVGFIENAGDGFYKINYDGAVGYSLAAYLSSEKPEPLSSNYSTGLIAEVVNCNEWITLRKTPSVRGEALDHIPLGSLVSFISVAENGFYCIEYRGQMGYALQSYLEVK